MGQSGRDESRPYKSMLEWGVGGVSNLLDYKDLPNSWECVNLKNLVSKLVDGSHNPPSKQTTGRPMLSARNINKNQILFDDFRYIGEADFEREHARTRITSGDVLLTIVGTIGRTAVVPSGLEGFSLQRSVAVLTPKGILSKYLMYQLEAPFTQKYFDEHARGTAQKGVYLKTLGQTPIIVAPLNEQTRIVAEIEKQFSRLDEAVANLKRVKANLKRYKAAVLKAAVEGKLTEEWRRQHPDVEPADKLLERILAERRKEAGKGKYREPVGPETSNLPELPAGWGWAKSDQLFSFVTSGSRGWASYYSETGAAFLRMGNLDHDTINLDLSDIQRVNPPSDSEGTRTRVEAGDILISITADVGMIGLVPEGFEEAYINQHVSLARSVSVECTAFVAWFLACKAGQNQFKELQRGATKVGLGLDDIRAVNVPLPPLAEQKAILTEIESRLSIVAGAEAQVDANLRRTDRLRQSILKQAFSGQLVPQDPSDEPASVLLERIRHGVGTIHESPARKPKRAIHESPLRKPQQPAEPKPAASADFACLDDVTAAILALMQPGREYARADLADALGLTTGRWNAAIHELKRIGKVRQVGEKRGARYEKCNH